MMGGTEIVVLQLRAVIKTALFAVIGLILIIALIVLLFSKDNNIAPTNSAIETERTTTMVELELELEHSTPKTNVAKYVAGTYSAQIILHNHPVDIFVTVDDQAITDVTLAQMPESEELFYPLFRPTMTLLSEEIVKTQSTDILLTNETAHTSKVLLSAVEAALEKAQYTPAWTQY